MIATVRQNTYKYGTNSKKKHPTWQYQEVKCGLMRNMMAAGAVQSNIGGTLCESE